MTYANVASRCVNLASRDISFQFITIGQDGGRIVLFVPVEILFRSTRSRDISLQTAKLATFLNCATYCEQCRRLELVLSVEWWHY